MTNEAAIECIEFVKSKRTDQQHLIKVLNEVLYYANSPGFSYQGLMRLIQDKTPTKLGGIYIEIIRGLSFLKAELKRKIKNHEY